MSYSAALFLPYPLPVLLTTWRRSHTVHGIAHHFVLSWIQIFGSEFHLAIPTILKTSIEWKLSKRKICCICIYLYIYLYMYFLVQISTKNIWECCIHVYCMYIYIYIWPDKMVPPQIKCTYRSWVHRKASCDFDRLPPTNASCNEDTTHANKAYAFFGCMPCCNKKAFLAKWSTVFPFHKAMYTCMSLHNQVLANYTTMSNFYCHVHKLTTFPIIGFPLSRSS